MSWLTWQQVAWDRGRGTDTGGATMREGGHCQKMGGGDRNFPVLNQDHKTISQLFKISFIESWLTAVAGLLRRGFFVLVVRVRGLVFLLVTERLTPYVVPFPFIYARFKLMTLCPFGKCKYILQVLLRHQDPLSYNQVNQEMLSSYLFIHPTEADIFFILKRLRSGYPIHIT